MIKKSYVEKDGECYTRLCANVSSNNFTLIWQVNGKKSLKTREMKKKQQHKILVDTDRLGFTQ